MGGILSVSLFASIKLCGNLLIGLLQPRLVAYLTQVDQPK
jgi:hypothetical protein